MRKLFALIAGIVLLSWSASAQKEAANSGNTSSSIKISVTKVYNGKPIRNATVVLHSVNKQGKQETGGVNLKTDSEGKTSFDGAPYGKLRVQVIAKGFQTYGEDFEINRPEQEIVIKLKPPADQYTIYGDNDKPKTEQPAPNKP